MKRIVLLALVTLTLTGCASHQSAEPKTANFLAEKFVGGQYLEGFTKGQPDFGFTLEAISQLSQTGIDLSTAKAWAFSDARPVSSNGLAGKLLFAAHAVGEDSRSATRALKLLKLTWLTSSPTTPDTDVFSISWQVLGLCASKAETEAKNAETVLVNLRSANGGWGGTDSTAIALMAFECVGDKSASQDAVRWLHKTAKGNHFEAFGGADVNGTAYAIMALESSGEEVSSMRKWLKSMLAKDGGLQTPWSNGAGDAYATAQGYLALVGSNYVELAKR